MSKETNPINLDSKLKKASKLTALTAVIALGASSCGFASRNFQEGEVVEKTHEEERYYQTTDFSLPIKIGDITIYPFKIDWLDDEDFILRIKNCNEDNCQERNFYVPHNIFNEAEVGITINLNGIEGVSTSDPDKRLN